MALPSYTLKIPAQVEPYVDISYAPYRFNIAESFGGTALNDPSEGLQVKGWRIAWDSTTAWVSIKDITKDDPPLNLFQVPMLQGITFCFDSNMQPVVGYETLDGSFLYYFNNVTNTFSTLTLPSGCRSLRLYHDDKRLVPVQLGKTDAVLFYLKEDKLLCRIQRERYLTEHTLATLASKKCLIRRLGMTRALRIQIELTGENLFVTSP